MDTKSLAKSKRAHTLHNKKHHPNQKVKAAPSTVGASGTDKAPVKAAVREKHRPSQGPASLPSNWDRYEDEDDSTTENQIDSQSSSQPTDIVVPKSKGADYAYLISEAKSQSSTRISSEIFPSLDDFVSDFGQGKDTFFAVRGESLLSSIQNDSFFVDDKTRASSEASFLSLNLNALSEQLAKIDLPKRLFMEADLFPPEQYSERGQEGQNSSQDHDNAIKNELQADTSSTSLNPVLQPTPNSYPKSVAKPSEKQSKLKSETADAELDMLLDSFADANLKEKVKEKTVAFDMDGTLDDLLKETSTPSLLDQKMSHEVKSVPVASKSVLLDDFDSWLDTI